MSVVEQTSGIRDAHRELTQSRILEAAIDLLRKEDLDAIRMADVAKKAGVTERTLYRHFATRSDLLKAVWPKLQARVGAKGFPSTVEDLIGRSLWLFKNFDEESGAVRASLFSSAGRELRSALNPERQAAIRRGVKEARPDLKGAELDRLCAVINLIGGAYGWALMKDAWNLDGAEAGRAASEAIAALLRAPDAVALKSKKKNEVKIQKEGKS